VLELLRTHPKVLLNGLVLDNPHYVTPDEYLPLRRLGVWAAFDAGERRVAELVAQGLSTSEVAVRESLPRSVVDRRLHRVFRMLAVSSRDELVQFLTERPDPG
jgi:DNA-binding CsgD family transcriptional regulator